MCPFRKPFKPGLSASTRPSSKCSKLTVRHEHILCALPLLCGRRHLSLLQLPLSKVGRLVDDDPRDASPEVEEFVQEEGHDAGREDWVIDPHVLRGRELAEQARVAWLRRPSFDGCDDLKRDGVEKERHGICKSVWMSRAAEAGCIDPGDQRHVAQQEECAARSLARIAAHPTRTHPLGPQLLCDTERVPVVACVEVVRDLGCLDGGAEAGRPFEEHPLGCAEGGVEHRPERVDDLLHGGDAICAVIGGVGQRTRCTASTRTSNAKRLFAQRPIVPTGGSRGDVALRCEARARGGPADGEEARLASSLSATRRTLSLVPLTR